MRWRRLVRNTIFRGMILGMGCAAVSWLFSSTALVRALENWALDSCFVFRGKRASQSAAKIVIIGIDDASFDALGKPMAFISPEMAEVVEYVVGEGDGAKSVGLDIMVTSGVEDQPFYKAGEPGDGERLGEVVGKAGNVVLPKWLIAQGDKRQWLLPLYQWRVREGPTDLGFVNLTLDSDAFARRQSLRAADEQGEHVHLALAVFAVAQRDQVSPKWCLANPLVWNERTIPLDTDDELLINYIGPRGSFPTVSFQEVLDKARRKEPLDPLFKGAIVLIGGTANSQQDMHTTPFDNQSMAQAVRGIVATRYAEFMPGVEILANVLATLADGAFITTPWWLSTPLLLAVVGSGMGILLLRTSLEGGFVITFVHHWVWRAVCIAAFWYGHWRVEMVPMLLLGSLLYAVVFAMRWRWVRQMMGMFKSEAIARALESDPSKLDLRGEERVMTILFSDVRNFTGYSERHTPHEVVQLLNEYFTAIVPAIEYHGGTINQYMGDGLMVLFGAPEQYEDHAIRSVRAAVAMVERVHALRGRWAQLGASDFRIGVGIHTGRVVVGTVGSPRRLDYSAIGDPVNTAARIEAQTKALEAEILISDATYQALPEPERSQLGCAPEAIAATLRHKQAEVFVHRVIVRRPSML